MRNRIRCALLTLALVIAAIVSAHAMPAGSRITLPTGKKIFVSGMNLAWINYGQDVVSFDSSTMAQAIKAVHDSGGNTMRIWLSTNGVSDPVFGTDGYVSGPNPNTVANIQKMLRIAKNNKMLLCLTMLTHNFMQNQGENIANNKTLLQTDAGISAYLTKYVTPVVTAIGLDPNLLCWEVFNEPEGMVENIGWTDNRITQANVQKVVNRVAGAIHKAVPGVLVSNGAVTMGYTSTVGGSNWYSDANLLAAGGDTAGRLDFYMAHYYGWNGVSFSPFTKACAYWNVDKPLVIGEFPAGSWSPAISSKNQDAAAIDTLFMHLYNTGYAGGMSWCYYGDKTDTWLGSFSTTAPWLAKLYRADSIDISISGNSDNKFQVSVSAGNGGAVTASLTGRIAPGAIDTLKAIALAGYTFAGWTGDTTASNPVLVLTVTRDRSIIANFAPNAGTNLIKNGDFSGGSTSWSFYAATGNSASVVYTSGYAAATVSQTDTFNYHIQLTQGSIGIVAGTAYEITFSAWSTAARPLSVSVSTDGTWNYQGGADFSLTSTKSPFTVTVTADTTTATGVLQFNLGKSTLPVYIDDVVMVKKASGSVAPVPAAASRAPRTTIRYAGTAISWTRSAPLANAGTLLMVSADGRELCCVKLSPGVSSCTIKAPAAQSGVWFMVMESGGVRETKAFTLTH